MLFSLNIVNKSTENQHFHKPLNIRYLRKIPAEFPYLKGGDPVPQRGQCRTSKGAIPYLNGGTPYPKGGSQNLKGGNIAELLAGTDMEWT